MIQDVLLELVGSLWDESQALFFKVQSPPLGSFLLPSRNHLRRIDASQWILTAERDLLSLIAVIKLTKQEGTVQWLWLRW